MIDPDDADLDLPTLLELHKRLGALICEEMGHEWERVEVTHHNRVYTDGTETCSRCGETRRSADSLPLSSGNDTTLTVTEDR